MQTGKITKYTPFPQIDLPDREWPGKTITHAPIWASVDLRDGNQALATPMNVDEKLEMFDRLVEIGFKEIEVGFPSASDTEFNFICASATSLSACAPSIAKSLPFGDSNRNEQSIIPLRCVKALLII